MKNEQEFREHYESLVVSMWILFLALILITGIFLLILINNSKQINILEKQINQEEWILEVECDFGFSQTGKEVHTDYNKYLARKEYYESLESCEVKG